MIKQKIKSHDHFIAKAMARTRVAKEFFQSHLPSEVRKLVDLDTLQQCNIKLLSNILGEGIVDFLYSVKFGDEEGYLSILLEHQSSPDKYMTFRIQKYMLRIYEEHLRKKPNTNLPLIFPIILYAGQSKYNAPKSFYDLFDHPELAKRFSTEDLTVISIRDIKDEELRKKYYSGAMLYLMKHILDKDIYPYLLAELPIFKIIIKEDFQYIEDMLYYIIEKAESKNKEKILSLFQEIAPPERKDEIMTIADELRAEGRAEGRAEALKTVNQIALEKLREGEKNKSIAVAKKMLAAGFDINAVAKITDLSVDELKNFLH